MKKLLLAAALVLSAPAAQAETPRWGSFQFKLGSYRPKIDSEFTGGVAPFTQMYGKSGALMFQAEFARSLFTGYGALDLGVGAGWYSKTAKAFVQGSTTERSGDNTSFRVLPLSLSLTYRLDLFAERFPLVPYAKVSLLRYQWWVTRGGGGTATATNGTSGSGATNGWGGAVGVAFLLDFLDPTLSREMDRDIGINDTYLFLEASKAKVTDFGADKSWNLSPDKAITWSGGLLFVF